MYLYDNKSFMLIVICSYMYGGIEAYGYVPFIRKRYVYFACGRHWFRFVWPCTAGFAANFAQEVMKGQLPLSLEGIRRLGSRTIRLQ